MYRVIVVIQDKFNGNIKNVRSWAQHLDLEVEAKRVIEELSQILLVEQKGLKIGVSNTLPLVIQVNE